MKIIITGALGHIGSYIVRDFAEKFSNSEILMLDNLSTHRYSSLFNLPTNVNYKFIEFDTSKEDIRPLLINADVVVHLAATTDAAGSFKNPSLIEENNYISTMKIAEACGESGVRLVIISSTSVYGTQKEEVNENCTIEELNPQSPYAITKLKEENFIKDLNKKKKINAVIFRFGTIFGISPGMRFHTAINKFCWQAILQKPLTVWSTAYHQKRPYLDIQDASNAIAFVIKNDIFDGEIYNVLTLNSTVCQIIELIKVQVPNLNIKFVDNEIMNQLSYEVSNKKLKSKGFIYTGNISKGIADTLNILKSSYKI